MVDVYIAPFFQCRKETNTTTHKKQQRRTLDLVLDEREERGEDDGQPRRQRGRQLVAQGLAPACRFVCVVGMFVFMIGA